MSSSELVQRLRAADATLASMSPAADLEARIRARACGRGALRLSSILAGARRLHRPLILAFATATALSIVSVLRGHGEAGPAPLARGPEEPAGHIVNDRSHADGGLREVEPGERGAGPKPVFHMPALAPDPERRLHPAPPQRPAASPSAPTPQEISPTAVRPSATHPSKWSEDVDDRGRGPARGDTPRASFSPTFRAVGAVVPVGSSVMKPSFVVRGGDATPDDVVSSTPRGGDSRGAAVECKSSNVLRNIALTTCAGTDQLLSTLTFLEPCGDGRFGTLYFECAELAPEPEADPTPDPGPEPGQCVQGSFEGGTSCVDLGGHDKDPIAGVQKQAVVACAALGLTLSELSVAAVGCPEQSGKVSYVCCPVPPQGPVSDSCHDDKIGADFCVDLSTLEDKASALCAQSGQVLTSLSPLPGCPDGQASVAMLSCCPTSF